MISDERLILQYCRGHRPAMATLVERYRDEMLNFFYHRVSSQPVAEDLVQELFLKIIRNAHRFQARAKFKTWMYRIALNQLKDYYKLARREVAGSIAEAESPVEFTAEIDRKSDLQRFLANLKQEFRTIIELTYFQDLSTQEVAGVLNLPEGTVKSRRFYALRELAKLLQEKEI